MGVTFDLEERVGLTADGLALCEQILGANSWRKATEEELVPGVTVRLVTRCNLGCDHHVTGTLLHKVADPLSRVRTLYHVRYIDFIAPCTATELEVAV